MPINLKNHTRELICIDQLLDMGNYKEALQRVETIKKRVDLPPTDRFTCYLLKIKLLIRLGDYEEGLRLAKDVLKENQRWQTRLHRVDALILIARALHCLGRIDESLNAVEQGEQELKPLARNLPAEVPQRKARLLRQKGIFYWMKGDMDRALKNCQQSLAIFKKIGNKLDIAEAFDSIGNIYREKGDMDQALDFCQKSLALVEEIGNKQAIARSLWSISAIIHYKGDLDRALEYELQSLALREEIGNKHDIASSLNNLGNIYKRKGDLEQALEYYQQSLKLREEIGNKQRIVVALFNIGEIYHFKGDLDQALKYYQQSLALVEEIGNKLDIAIILTNLGEIYQFKGDLDQAMVHLEQSLALHEEFGTNLYTAETLYNLISVTIDKNLLDRAQQYLQRLKLINEQEDNKVIRQQYHVAEALVLKTSPRARYRGKAEELLEQVVEEEVVEHRVTVMALLNLCDLLITELHMSGEQEMLGEVHALVTRLREIATQQHSHWVLAETYVLQAKLALVELDLPKARQLLEQAQQLAEERGLRRLAIQISSEHDALLEQLNQWETFIDRNVSLAERTELAHLENQVVRMIRKRVEKLPELPHEKPELVLIIGADSGLSVFSKAFRPDRPVAEQLIAGFLTAINALVRDAFAVEGSIERIKHQEYTLLLKAIEPFLVSYVFQGPSYFALQKLNQFIEALQASKTVWQAITDALQTRRLVAEGSPVEALVTEMFLTPAEGH